MIDNILQIKVIGVLTFKNGFFMVVSVMGDATSMGCPSIMLTRCHIAEQGFFVVIKIIALLKNTFMLSFNSYFFKYVLCQHHC